MTTVDPGYTAPYVGDFPHTLPVTHPTSMPAIPTWFIPQQPIITRTMAEMCNHCWCERCDGAAGREYKPDHARCCKCRDTMHDRFIAESVPRGQQLPTSEH